MFSKKNLVIVLVIVFSSCMYVYEQKALYKRAYNTERIKKGLPIIPKEWNEITGDEFVNPKSFGARHDSKKLYYNEDIWELCIECDIYYSGKKYIYSKGGDSLKEGIMICYDWDKTELPENEKWDYSIFTKTRHGKISRKEALMYLKKWNIKRLNYTKTKRNDLSPARHRD